MINKNGIWCCVSPDLVYQPEIPILVPLSAEREGEYEEYARFNTNVDAAFTTHVSICAFKLPFDPATEEASRAQFVQRASAYGITSFDQFEVKGEAREKVKESLRLMLGDLGKLYLRDPSGPFLLGQQASYADLIVGGWLRMMKVCLPENEWEEVSSWHGGLFGRLYDGLEKFMEVK